MRNLILGAWFSSPHLFKPGLSIMRAVANSRSALLNPDKNPLVAAVVKPLIYNHFCAGSNKREIDKTKAEAKGIGFSGIILCYGKETGAADIDAATAGNEKLIAEVNQWRDGNLETLDMVGDGDWLGMKFTGAGTQVTKALMRNEEPPAAFTDAMNQICDKAQALGCRLWVDSEQQAVQTSIDRWTIPFMRKYNTHGNAVVYNTLQAYLKESRSKLTAQLRAAKEQDFTLAIKLVRGAYIDSDPRERIHDTKEDTDASYNGIVHDLLSGTNLGLSQGETLPKVQLFLAGHNPASVGAAIDLMQSLAVAGKLHVKPDFGQLQGMADELGCSALQRADQLRETQKEAGSRVAVPLVYKCLTWGSVQECMQYLLRRAVENSGGTARMKDGYAAYLGEAKRRIGSALRLRA